MRTLPLWAGGLALVACGFAASPAAVPIYDGVGAPDQPYRFVVPPAGTPAGPAPTGAEGHSSVQAGVTTAGLSLTTGEVGPQVSLFLPSGALAASKGPVTVRVSPVAPSQQPPAARIDGNVVRITADAPGGPVTVTDRVALASLALRSTTGRQPGPVVEARSGAGAPWHPLTTTRSGQDIYVAPFTGPGDYALAYPQTTRKASRSLLPFVLGASVLVLALVLLVVRRQATRRP